MIILATDSNDKGRQLETLTKRLLEKWGYTDTRTNLSANGSEIDVRAKIEIPPVGQRTAICECKAHQSLVDMTDWCKFLGKVYHQSVIDRTEVIGCFVSLKGVNGKVLEHFESFSEHGRNVKLLDRDALEREVSELIPFVPLKLVSEATSQLTPRTPSRFELAYREGDIYWIVQFSGGEFSIVDARGHFLGAEDAEVLSSMVKTEIDASGYIDVKKEQKAKERKQQARTIVLGELFRNAGRKSGFEQIDDFTPSELENISLEMVTEGIVQKDGDAFVIPVSQAEHGELVLPTVFQTLFNSAVHTAVIESEFYQSHVNYALLKVICEIQGNLPLSDEARRDLLYILKLSPSALAKSVWPIDFIVVSRKAGEDTSFIDAFHTEIFQRELYDSLLEDFTKVQLREYFYTHKDILEIESRTTFQVKNSKAVEFEGQSRKRMRIGRGDETFGNRLVLMEVIKESEEPWTMPKIP